MKRVMKANEGTPTVMNFTAGEVDKQGRQIGYRVTVNVVEFVEVDDGARTWYNLPYSGWLQSAQIQQTRGGEPFGPLQAAKYFLSVIERDEHIAATLWKRAKIRMAH